MKTRTLGRCGLMASEVGLGCEHLQGLPYEQVKSVIDAALAGGVNIMDVFMSEPEVRSNIGKALKGRREQQAPGGPFRLRFTHRVGCVKMRV